MEGEDVVVEDNNVVEVVKGRLFGTTPEEIKVELFFVCLIILDYADRLQRIKEQFLFK